MEAFIYIISCFLALVGAATVIRAIVFYIFKYDLKSNAVTVIYLDNSSYEMTIRASCELQKWKRGMPSIVAIDNGLDERTKNEAQILLNEYGIKLYDNTDFLIKK